MTVHVEEILLAAEQNDWRLREDTAAKLEELLRKLKPGPKPEWYPIVNFLLGMFYSDQFWENDFPTKANQITAGREFTDKVVNYFSAFLRSTHRPCFELVSNELEFRLPIDTKFWACFGFAWNAFHSVQFDPCIPLTGDDEHLDFIGVALDRLALAYYLDGQPELSADALVAAIESPTSSCWTYWHGPVDLTRLLAWIGWLYFDGGVFDKAAEYMQECVDSLPQHPEEGSSPATASLIRLSEMYMNGGNCEGDWRHAVTEVGDHWNFLPSGTLVRGCDAFMIRLSISLASQGGIEEALKAAETCIAFGEPLRDLQFEVLEDYKPVPFPEARLFRAALRTKLGSWALALSDLEECVVQVKKYINEACVLTCICLLQSEGVAIESPTELKSTQERVSGLSEQTKRVLLFRCERVLNELLDRTDGKRGLNSETAAVICRELNLHSHPIPDELKTILGHPVISMCSDCDGEGVLWSVNEEETSHQGERCPACNSIGYLLDVSDQSEIPF
ncbi:tetratricopeptide repeat protein [Bremerella sp. T1]|uniref:tetratricopeptide repeat protein n=1 Tax=Bremerella sp. TYQ1 TaxID=3119568 RepID=UPI001CCCD18D|nr:tetratricopeptide repeat protein [Bremerella volcania]UBM35300.1 tetratricopeptide repeat protein [Bremerella volcania]